MPKKMTLKKFIQKEGSQEKAARKLGVTFATVNRWLRKKTTPSFLAQARMAELGISV